MELRIQTQTSTVAPVILFIKGAVLFPFCSFKVPGWGVSKLKIEDACGPFY